MPLDVSTLRPGFLVSLKTSVSGNVSYQKETIQAEHKVRSGAVKAKWQTERTIEDPEEHKKASQVRMKARQIVSSVCAVSAFGLLCPEASQTKLELAIKEARRVVEAFNRRAKLTRVGVYVISGKIARDDVEAVRAIKSEVRDLLNSMSEGVKTLDVEAVRSAANKARNIGSMLSPEAAEKIKGAIEAARGAARKIVKAGEAAAQEIDQEAVRSITQARTAFLDLEDDAAEIAHPTSEARAVDLEPEGAVTGRLTAETANSEEVTPEPRRQPRKKFTGKRKTTKTVTRRRATAEAAA